MRVLLLIIGMVLIEKEKAIYSLSFEDIRGNVASLKEFKGRKLLVTSFDAENTDQAFISYYDSLQNNVDSLQVVLVPIAEKEKVKLVKKILAESPINSSLLITYPSSTRKAEKDKQHSLYRWLTSANENGHFEVEGELGQIFLIDNHGNLYAVLNDGVPKIILQELIKQ